MIKQNELRDPGSCLNRADDDEPIFVIRAKDAVGAATVRLWATVAKGIHEPEKIDYAHALARRMESWRMAQIHELISQPDAPETHSDSPDALPYSLQDVINGVRAKYPNASTVWAHDKCLVVDGGDIDKRVLATGETVPDAWSAAYAAVVSTPS